MGSGAAYVSVLEEQVAGIGVGKEQTVYGRQILVPP